MPQNHINEKLARSVPGTQAPCYMFETSDAASLHVAQLIASTIRERNALGHVAVLGLVAGSTPIGVYRALVRLHQEDGLDMSRVVTFSINEYYGLNKEQAQSQTRVMHDTLFQHVNIPDNNIHVFDPTIPPSDVDVFCRHYDDAIRTAGSFDLVILGIGPNGSVGFNEPYTSIGSKTRLTTLDPITRHVAASDFFSESNVPLQGLTVGMSTILEAKKILVLAFGDHKAKIVKRAVEENTSDAVPVSRLRDHSGVSYLIDKPAASALTSIVTPWVVSSVQWNETMIKRAVLWLCEKSKKALLKLTDDDFREYGLHQLLRLQGPAPALCHRVFLWLSETINYHPGNIRVQEENNHLSGQQEPHNILCFSPHPDDDVICMGGTIIRLVEDRHRLHIAYMTSGNIAVHDHDAMRIANLMTQVNKHYGIDVEKTLELKNLVRQSLNAKTPGMGDSIEVLNLKRLIRQSEAEASANVCGCFQEDLHFLDLPFYRTGTIDKKPPTEEDHAIVRRCIEEVAPQQIYVAGDMTDPHGTHRVCAIIILHVLQQMRQEGLTLPEVLLYRGAWQEWPLDQIEIAVPLSPGDLEKKRSAIFRHESQKDRALFPGSDSREFWQRAEDRNKNTAALYNQIGLPEYFALEAFVRWNGTFDF
ncbi:MAG: 6-phosphogluconolactonase [Planctomycetaceae bacterium]|jgi:glucosamine-6-phosphate deaminase|nr:6-phosphogluconolactonase [Planctomycetaceae bacterium]